jgi:hypothetical protein
MALYQDLNLLPATGPKGIVSLVNLLLSAGWTLYAWYGQLAAEGRARHIGLDTWAGVGNQFDTAGDWVELVSPNGQCVPIMHGASNVALWVRYSVNGPGTDVDGASGAFDTYLNGAPGTNEVQDEYGTAAAGTDFFQADGSYRLSVLADDTHDTFHVLLWQTGSFALSGWIAFDYATPDAGTDVDPYVFGMQGNSTTCGTTTDVGHMVTGMFHGWMERSGAGTGAWKRVSFCTPSLPNGMLFTAGPFKPNGLTGKDEWFPLWYCRPGLFSVTGDGTYLYSKGVSTDLGLCISSSDATTLRASLSTFNGGEKLIYGQMVFPWRVGSPILG